MNPIKIDSLNFRADIKVTYACTVRTQYCCQPMVSCACNTGLSSIKDPRYGMRDMRRETCAQSVGAELDLDRGMWVTNWLKQGLFSSQ